MIINKVWPFDEETAPSSKIRHIWAMSDTETRWKIKTVTRNAIANRFIPLRNLIFNQITDDIFRK